MNELTQVFNYNTKEVRTVTINSEPWFVAKDVCEILEINSVTDAVKRLSDNMKATSIVSTQFGEKEMNIVSEAGLYKLIFTSRKKEAERFTDWVASEVIPTIRKTGGYVNNDDLFINTYLPFADDTTKVMFRNTLQVVKTQNELIKKQQAEIEYKEDVIINLIDAITLADKRQVLNRVVKHKGANYQDRWRELYKQFEMKYHINLTVRLENYNKAYKPKLSSKLDYIDKVLSKLPELFDIACKLYENDIKELTEEMYALV